jgi:hypothetical protein
MKSNIQPSRYVCSVHNPQKIYSQSRNLFWFFLVAFSLCMSKLEIVSISVLY